MEHTGARLLRIGEVARLLGLTPKTILYYEQRRLLRPAARSEAGHRLYSDKEVARLQFIERAKLLQRFAMILSQASWAPGLCAGVPSRPSCIDAAI